MEEGICERILTKINSHLEEDPLIDEFDIIVSNGDTNKSPIIYVEHKLALESWCVKHVYSYANRKILQSVKFKSFEEACRLVRWTEFCLLISPDVSTFWNIRKNLLLKEIIGLESELVLIKIILSRKPKCMEAYQQKRWIIDNIILKRRNLKIFDDLNNYESFLHQLEDFFISELKLCTNTANKHQNNYHSWNHRIWILDKIQEHISKEEIILSEFKQMHIWVETHVSEHSGLHYLQYLINIIVEKVKLSKINVSEVFPTAETVQDLYINELELNKELIIMYVDHESLFYHRRFLLKKMQDLIKIDQRTSCSPPPAMKRSCVENISSNWASILASEHVFIESCLKCTTYQSILAKKHLQWINKVLVN